MLNEIFKVRRMNEYDLFKQTDEKKPERYIISMIRSNKF